MYGDFMKAIGASERVFALIERIPQVRAEGGESLKQTVGEIQFDQVYFSYPSRPETLVIKNLNLHLVPGKVVALVGPSGGGKTTIVNLAELLYYPKQGTITFDGVNIQDLDPHFLHKQIGMVSQEPSLFACTVAENISYGTDDSDFESTQEKEKRIVEVATMANAHDFIMDFPEQYNTMVGERGIRLSGGQKQRVAIARALLRRPKVLLLDETTSALDAESEYLVKEAIDLLLKSSEGRTVLVIAHRLSTVKSADEVLVIDQGTVVERGTHEELIIKDGIYKKLVNRQLQRA